MEKNYTTDDYISALKQIKITEHHKRMLQIHYDAHNRTLTATQMSTAMGYKNFNASNLQYGRLGKFIGMKLGWKSIDEVTGKVNVLAKFKKSEESEWLWIMRQEVAEALEKLGWINSNQITIPEEVKEANKFYEGAVRSISVNAYERNTEARSKCILYYGHNCSVCGINLVLMYGEVAQGYIHVHHLRPLSEINATYEVNRR
ncbi:MAG TPA: HNH endonuclease [Thermodesulfovibrionia bacterium]|nr:HNH endonuclease [Thermodesulfovibrionia bacterium]